MRCPFNTNELKMDLGIILWICVAFSIFTTTIRALNIGFQKETYILSSLTYIPLIYDAWLSNSNQNFVLNGFYLLISLLAVYRWSKFKQD